MRMDDAIADYRQRSQLCSDCLQELVSLVWLQWTSG
jgi:hypothetical protein